MKSQSFSLLVESIKDNNLDSLLQVLVHAKIPILSKKIKRAVIVIGMVAVIFWIVLPSVANSIIAQSSYSVYPVYPGYIKNPDGILTLSFAYFSHNSEPVTISICPNNAFSPGLADRGQRYWLSSTRAPRSRFSMP